MAKIIQDKQVVSSNWLYIPSAEFNADALAQADYLFLDYAVWQHNQGLAAHVAPVLDAAGQIEDMADAILDLPVIGLFFASIKEGRGYSQARILREDYSYTGDLHALGVVSLDHLCFMHRCGINAMHLDNQDDLDQAARYFADIQVTYQR
jgi:uncharacterized protein (DUF934 family)